LKSLLKAKPHVVHDVFWRGPEVNTQVHTGITSVLQKGLYVAL